MTLLSRLGVSLCVVLSAAPPVWAVDIWTVGVDNTRQGWNRTETTLTVENVCVTRTGVH